MIITDTQTSTRQAATSGLAVIGFVALIVLGISLAIYSARFVPGIADGLGAAAVYLGSVFMPSSGEPTLSVVSSATTTTPTENTSSTSTTSVALTTPPTSTPPKPVAHTTPGTPSSATYPIGGNAVATTTLYGLPDLVVTIDAVGYLASSTTDSFVATTTVPVGSRPAVKFTIKNVGTNVAAPWRFSASLPAQSTFIYQSQPQQSLMPGDSIAYTLGFDQANKGANQTISITANFDKALTESNANNNSASVTFTALGS